ncbi:tetratricopeptide repeat protein, partial [Paenibacillus nuruki]|uniref:tetratricopeptide repeat protein n=1 Tax=Paenibacillus nuruki TaxID=1886670 RepID=UPI001112D03D
MGLEVNEIEKSSILYQKAKSLDISVDDRIYKSNIFNKEQNYEKAIEILEPIDNEELLLNAINTYLLKNQGDQVENLVNSLSIEITPMIQQALARSFLQAGLYDRAIRAIKKAIKQEKEMPYHYLIAGCIYYWKGIPDDLKEYRSTFFPVLLNAPVSLFEKQATDMEQAKLFFYEAIQLASAQKNKELVINSKLALLLTISTSSNSLNEKKEQALSLLDEDKNNYFAFSYLVFNNISFEEKYVEPFIEAIEQGDKNLDLVNPLIIYYLNKGQNELANELLEDYKSLYNLKQEKLTWIKFKIDLIYITENQDKALMFLEDEDISEKEKESLRLQIKVRNADNLNQIDILEKLIQLQKDRYHYEQLSIILRYEKNWSRLIEISKDWFSFFQDPRALLFEVESYFNLKDYQTCLKLLDKMENIADQKISKEISFFKLDILVYSGQWLKAINLADSLWIQYMDVELLLKRSIIYSNSGDILRSIVALKDGIDKRITSADLYIYLSQLLLQINPSDAFKYAKEGYDIYNTEELYRNLIGIGFKTNLDQETNQLLIDYQTKFPTNKYFKKINISEFSEMVDEHRKNQEQNNSMYEDGDLPIHILLESSNIRFASNFLETWDVNVNSNKIFKNNLYLLYGGKQNNASNLNEYDSIVLDYTACLTIFSLDLFNAITVAFENVLISPYLINCIQDEIRELTIKQPKLIQSKKNILKAITRLKIEKVSLDKEAINMIDQTLQPFDGFLFQLAKSHNALIGIENFTQELLNDGSQLFIPEALKAVQVTSDDIVNALIKLGEINSEDLINTRYFDLPISSKVDLIIEKKPIIIDEIVLEILLENNWIDAANNHFYLLVTDHLEKELNNIVQHEVRKQELIQSLEDLLNRIKILIEGKQIQYIVRTNNNLDTQNLIAIQLNDVITIGRNRTNVALWIDDRHLNSYDKIDENSKCFCVLDIIIHLKNKGIIKFTDYINKLSRLIKVQVQYFIPPVDYIYHLLKPVQIEQGNLRETTKLRELRHFIAKTFFNNNRLRTEAIGSYSISEIKLILFDLQKSTTKILNLIWSEENKGLDWKYGTSNWIMTNVYT